jgi:hypothetical protein
VRAAILIIDPLTEIAGVTTFVSIDSSAVLSGVALHEVSSP